MKEVKDNDEVKFSDKQINALERILNSDVRPLIIKEIKNNYIPRSLPEEILKIAKKTKRRIKRKTSRKTFISRWMYICFGRNIKTDKGGTRCLKV